MFNAKAQKLMTLDNIFIEKVFVSKTELRCSRQEITRDDNIFKNLKSVRKKSIKDENFYES